MRSKSFDMQEVRETGRREAGDSRGFPIHRMGIMEDVFQMEGKDAKSRRNRRCEEENLCQSEEDALHRISNFVWASGSKGGKVGGSYKKFSGEQEEQKDE